MLSDLASLGVVMNRAFARRRSRRHWAAYEAARGPLPTDHFAAGVYFADSLVNLYQLQQWYAPLQELDKTHPVVVITRNVTTADFLRDTCPFPVAFLNYMADVEAWVADQPLRVVFYLNQNARNFQMMRFREPAHVFLSHGESEKDYMASNQLKAYDYAFIAGDAARDRLRGKLIGYDVDARTLEIGRPQVDVHHQPPTAMPDDGRTVVLYSPTWEGDRPSMTYSSVRTHAPAMIAALLETGRHRVVYRPHPRTGIFDAHYKDANKRIVDMIERANKTDPGAHHVIDLDSEFGWHLDAADICIADISAVAFDWLAIGKPIVLTRPTSANAEVDENGIAGSLLTVTAKESASITELLEHASDPQQVSAREALVARHFGDVAPGASMARWLEAAHRVIAERAPAGTTSGPAPGPDPQDAPRARRDLA